MSSCAGRRVTRPEYVGATPGVVASPTRTGCVGGGASSGMSSTVRRLTEMEARLDALEQAAGVSGASIGFSPFGNLTTGLILGGMLLITPGLIAGYRRYMG